MSKQKTLFLRLLASLVMILLLDAVAANSQTIDTLSLDQCIGIAIRNNQNLKNKKLDELINQASIDETKADLYPQLKLKGSYQYYLNVPRSLVSSALFGGPPTDFTYGEFQVPQNINASANIEWQVYNPAILAALKISKLSKDMSTMSTKDKLEMVIYDVSATYLNVQINELQIGLTRSNIANLKRNLELTTQLFNQGLALRSDVDNLTVSVVNLETVLSNQLNGLKQLYYLLKIYMGLPPSYAMQMEKYTHENTVYNPISETDSTAFTKRTGYISLKQTGDLLELERKSIKTGRLPTLNLVGSFGYNGLNRELTLFENYNNKWNPINMVQLNLEIPVFDGFKRRNQLLKNKLKQDQNTNSLENLRNTFQMEQMNAINSYNHYVTDLSYQTKNLALANKLYTQKQLEYKNNTASLNDIIAVENTLKSAQANYLNSLVKLKIAELDIKKANGQLIKN